MRIPGQVTGLWDRDLILADPLRYARVQTQFQAVMSGGEGGYELWIFHFILISPAPVCADVRKVWHTDEFVCSAWQDSMIH